MIKTKNITVDTRGITREVTTRLMAERSIKNFKTVGAFVDNNVATIAGIIAKFYLAQISNQKSATISSVRNDINDLIDRKFAPLDPELTRSDLADIRVSVYQAIASGFFTRLPYNQGNWHTCSLVKLSSTTYTVQCKNNEPTTIERGYSRISLNPTDRQGARLTITL